MRFLSWHGLKKEIVLETSVHRWSEAQFFFWNDLNKSSKISFWIRETRSNLTQRSIQINSEKRQSMWDWVHSCSETSTMWTAQSLWAFTQHGRLTVHAISLVFFFFPLAGLSTWCQPVQQKNNEEKCSQATFTYLCIYFCIYSLAPLLAGLPLAACLSIWLWAAWQLCISTQRNQTKHKKHLKWINTPALSFPCTRLWLFYEKYMIIFSAYIGQKLLILHSLYTKLCGGC